MPTGKFHSAYYAQLPAPGQANPSDIWFATDQGLTYWADFQGNLHQLLDQSPFPTIGPQGPTGLTGATGEPFTTVIQFSGNWLPSPQVYFAGQTVSFNAFLYLCLADRNISSNVMPPEGNPFWKLLRPSTFSGRTSAVICVVDGGGQTPNTGFKGFFALPFACTITGFTLLADQSGSAQFDVKWSTYAGLPTTVSIAGSAKPTLTSQQKTETLDVSTLWSPITFNAGDTLEIDLISATTCTFLTLELNVTAT